ncbi:Vps62-related protein, partial [Candidatus Bathyarchaeota archaeon]|nr:Vps62-related protein [Candidatus Bathyarchaeota archaeon]NIV67935.1 Vps62-related protein [Candidatus Bathyarchaeota archaeon]
MLDSKETEMAKKYVPHLHFASGEQFFPTTANYHMERSELWLKSDGTNQLIDSNPTVTSISHYTSGDYFLSNRLDSVEEIAEDYNQAREKIGDTVYARVTRDSLSGNLIVQYWFFYAFNPGTLNQHQGDWEMIEIILDSTERPTYAVYSQHFSGERAIWNDVEKVDGTHPRVYVALGSHASYFKPYQGKLGLESDTVGSREEIPWEDLDILYLGEMGSGKHPATQDWLEYGGRWGNWAELADIARGAAGPSGPGHGENEEKWVHPASWGSDLFLVNQSWFMLSWVAYYFLYIFTTII